MEANVTSVNFEAMSRGVRFVKLPTPITIEDLQGTIADLSSVSSEMTEKKLEYSTLGKEIKKLSTKQQRLIAELQQQTKHKEVQCETFYDWENGKKWIRRLDTMELVSPEEGEPITDIERQKNLDGIEPDHFDDEDSDDDASDEDEVDEDDEIEDEEEE